MMWRRSNGAVRLADDERAELLRDAGRLLRLGQVGDVEERLSGAGGRATGDATCLNLLGIVSEARGHPKVARRFYRRAMRADPAFEAARQNVRRLYELETFGRTTHSVAVGEAATDLWFARHTRAAARPASPAGTVE